MVATMTGFLKNPTLGWLWSLKCCVLRGTKAPVANDIYLLHIHSFTLKVGSSNGSMQCGYNRSKNSCTRVRPLRTASEHWM
jgi:hypothetical protein